MTKQHFEAIAYIIKDNLSKYNSEKSLSAIRILAYDLADYLAKQNERFDYGRFLKACGLES